MGIRQLKSFSMYLKLQIVYMFLSLASADYNNCHKKSEEVCIDTTRKVCDDPVESYESKEDCQTKYVDQCTTEYEDVCETVTKNECRTETTTRPGEPGQKCSTNFEDQCNYLPTTKCKKEKVPVTDLVPECRTEHRTVVEYVQDRECDQVQEQVCNQVPEESCHEVRSATTRLSKCARKANTVRSLARRLQSTSAR